MSVKENKEKNKKPETITLSHEEYEALKTQADKAKEYLDQTLRTRADYDNALKRAERQKTEFVKFAEQTIVMEFLTILDDLERTKEAADEKHSKEVLMEGVTIIYKHLMDILTKRGVTTIEESNVAFDPERHQIMEVVKDPGVKEPKVVEVLRKGYALHNLVVRPASVKVAVAKDDDSALEGLAHKEEENTTQETPARTQSDAVEEENNDTKKQSQ
jgi:molecular chaperone GrpE